MFPIPLALVMAIQTLIRSAPMRLRMCPIIAVEQLFGLQWLATDSQAGLVAYTPNDVFEMIWLFLSHGF